MATNFPTNIDTFTDQTSSDLITSAKWNNLQDAIEALEVKVGADNSTVTTSHDYKLAELAMTLGAITSAADVADFEKLHAITSTHTEINQLHESGVVKADLEKLHAITSTHTEINQLHGSGVVKADFEKLHGITSSATEINQLHESGVVKADFEKLHGITVPATQINTIGKIKARAYRKAAQSIGDTGWTKIAIDTISFDTDGVVNITNSRIVPNLPGYYVVMGDVRVSAVPEGRQVNALIHKNGVMVTYGTSDSQGAVGISSSSASDLIYMNGTTDYLELFAYNSHSSTLYLNVGQPYQNYISIVGPF